MKRIAEWMDAVASDAKNTEKLASIARDVAALCSGFPVPGID
jgi:glycine/serine hydroxymethyltransferase